MKVLKKIIDHEFVLLICLLASIINVINPIIYNMTFNVLWYITVILTTMSVAFSICNKKVYKKDAFISVLYLVSISISTILSNYDFNLFKIAGLIINAILMFYVFYLDNSKTHENLFVLFIYISFAFTIISLCLYLFPNIFSQFYVGTKFAGIYVNPNIGGQIAALSIIISIYYINKSNYKYFFSCNVIVQFIYILLCECRTAWFGLIITIALYLLLKVKNKLKLNLNKRNKKIAICTIFILFFSLLINVPAQISSSFKVEEYTKFEKIVNDMSTSRYSIWKESSALILKNPLFGYGVGSLNEAAIDMFGESSIIAERNYMNAHNFIIQILLDGGIVALLIFTYLLYKVLKRLILYITINQDEYINMISYVIILSVCISLLDYGIVDYLSPLSLFFWIGCSKILHYKNQE
ncbi:MAG: O-antigen ligase family protein [Erysipelotrichaceae bacterium]